MQATRELRSTGIMQHKRVSNRVGRPCSIRNRVLRVVCAGSTSAPPRAAMKSADRNLKRATRAFGFVWSCYRYIWARSKSASRARPGGHINGTQRRDFANELCLSSTHYQRAAETGTSIEKTARETATD